MSFTTYVFSSILMVSQGFIFNYKPLYVNFCVALLFKQNLLIVILSVYNIKLNNYFLFLAQSYMQKICLYNQTRMKIFKNKSSDKCFWRTQF